jgi:hypothetical protein
MNNKMVNGVVGGAVVEVDRRESESKGCNVFYPFGLAPPGVDTYVLWCVDRGRHKRFQKKAAKELCFVRYIVCFLPTCTLLDKNELGTGDPEKFGDSSVTISVDYLFR